jgi:hypothetical protein
MVARGFASRSGRSFSTLRHKPPRRASLALVLGVTGLFLLAGNLASAHSPVVDSDLSDWCAGTDSNSFVNGGRTEDSSATLSCGNCSITTDFACNVNSDCPGGETCVNLGSRTEVVWWDNRTDGAVNDLATVIVTFDDDFIYFAAELWVDPDPVSLPFGEIAIEVADGRGIPEWFDEVPPFMTTPGTCSVSTDRACTRDEDCWFCAIDTEPDPDGPGGITPRVRACGSTPSLCSDTPGDVCDQTQTCENLGAGAPNTYDGVGVHSSPVIEPDYLVMFDFSRWLFGATDATAVFQDLDDGGIWCFPRGASASPDPRCTLNTGDPNALNAVFPAVDPGASGGSGGPPGRVEVALPWSFFSCDNAARPWTGCAGFGPGDPFVFTMTVARGASNLDYDPDGPHEDTMSEAVAGSTTTTTNSCPGFGIGNTSCEIADGSTDAFALGGSSNVPGGRVDTLMVNKNANPAPSVTLTWNPSCSGADSDYSVMEGDISTLNSSGTYSHEPVSGLCTTAGTTGATFDAAAGDRYYLVVPNDGSTEGSYGRDSSSTERPPAGTPCLAQSLGNC